MQFTITSEEGLQFIQCIQSEMPVLVYANLEQADVIKKLIGVVELHDNIDHSMLKQLDVACDGLGKYPLILTTDSTHMRGLDFRAPRKGICLLIG